MVGDDMASFNSTVVRLKVVALLAHKRFASFQFHSGSIKSRAKNM